MARVYADVNARLGPSWYDYGQSSAPLLHASWLLERCVLTPPTESLSVDWNVPDRYEIVRRIGGGRYSEVRATVFFYAHGARVHPGGELRSSRGSIHPTKSLVSLRS